MDVNVKALTKKVNDRLAYVKKKRPDLLELTDRREFRKSFFLPKILEALNKAFILSKNK